MVMLNNLDIPPTPLFLISSHNPLCHDKILFSICKTLPPQISVKDWGLSTYLLFDVYIFNFLSADKAPYILITLIEDKYWNKTIQ